MKNHELQKAWQEVQERISLPARLLHDTAANYMAQKSSDLLLMLQVMPQPSVVKANIFKSKEEDE